MSIKQIFPKGDPIHTNFTTWLLPVTDAEYAEAIGG